MTRRIPKPGLELLREAGLKITHWESDEVIPRGELLERVRDVDGIYCLLTDRIDRQVLDDAGPQLKVLSTMSVGFEHLDLKECKKRGIAVGFTPDVLTSATSELCIALLLATARRIIEGSAAVRSGAWQTWKPSWMCGQTLHGSVVGLVGLGRIGRTVASCLKPFGVTEVVYSSRSPPSDSETSGLARYVTFDELLRISDFVVVTCSLNESTRKLFKRETFEKMKPTSVFINISRGAIVDQNDLYCALKNKVIWGAGLDVTEPEPLPLNNPLLMLDNCVILPHIGSATLKTRSDMATLAAKNLLAGLLGQKMPSQLDL